MHAWVRLKSHTHTKVDWGFLFSTTFPTYEVIETKPLCLTLKVPGRRALLQVPQKWSPYKEKCPSPEPFLNILQGPRRGSIPSRFLWQSPTERNTPSPEPPSAISRSPSRWAYPRLPNWASIKRDPQSLPFITYRFFDKGALSPGSPKRSSRREKCPFSRAPFQLSLRVPGERTYPSSEPPPYVLLDPQNGAPTRKDVPVPEPSIQLSGSPVKEPSPRSHP
jgi:hypothetical protein